MLITVSQQILSNYNKDKPNNDEESRNVLVKRKTGNKFNEASEKVEYRGGKIF